MTDQNRTTLYVVLGLAFAGWFFSHVSSCRLEESRLAYTANEDTAYRLGYAKRETEAAVTAAQEHLRGYRDGLKDCLRDTP
jgi:hypothetical protein